MRIEKEKFKGYFESKKLRVKTWWEENKAYAKSWGKVVGVSLILGLGGVAILEMSRPGEKIKATGEVGKAESSTEVKPSPYLSRNVEIRPNEIKTYRNKELGVAFEYFAPSRVETKYEQPKDYLEGLVTVTDKNLFGNLEKCGQDKVKVPCRREYEKEEERKIQIGDREMKKFDVYLEENPLVEVQVYENVGEKKLEIGMSMMGTGMIYQQQRILASLRDWGGEEVEIWDPEKSENWKEIVNEKMGVKVSVPGDVIEIQNGERISLSYSGPNQASQTELFDGYFLEIFPIQVEEESVSKAVELWLKQDGWGYQSGIETVETKTKIFRGKESGEVISLDGGKLRENEILVVKKPKVGEFLVIENWYKNYGEAINYEKTIEKILGSIEFLW